MEHTLYFSKPHPIIFVWPLIFYWLGTYLLMVQLSWHNPGVAFIGVGVVLSIAVSIVYRNAYFLLTTQKIFLGSGLFRRKNREIPLNDIADIRLQQTISGFFLRYGTLQLVGDQGKKAEFRNIRKPRYAKQQLERAIAEARE